MLFRNLKGAKEKLNSSSRRVPSWHTVQSRYEERGYKYHPELLNLVSLRKIEKKKNIEGLTPVGSWDECVGLPLIRSTLTPTTPSSTPTSQLGHVPDNDSMRLTLKLCFECLDRLYGKMDHVHKEILGLEILEIRARMTELLARCEPEDAVGNSSAWDGNIDLQAIVDDEPQTIVPVALYELNAISPLLTPSGVFYLPHPQVLQGQFPDPEYSPIESIGNLPEGTDRPVGQLFRGEFAIIRSIFIERLPCATRPIGQFAPAS
ncbi:uncharacterized protein EDB91DRAFT_1160865 [Suillus paluster]|uniref:uncharacterized protein n=1 Tax=Suillus paluster TaxID=48578 RepID=UPI001B886861|nr:uncharacterized protein EDB91DRAFT_1160865 [Suillus paluster]KAG1728722.1 hypothetical protein EDB91DRAFT_1160865 [Suillus paluster]